MKQNEDLIQPYRTIAVREKEVKITHGFLHREPDHRCDLPGFWKRLFNGVKEGTLFRCGGCNKIWRWRTYIFSTGGTGSTDWVDDVSLETWISAGGSE